MMFSKSSKKFFCILFLSLALCFSSSLFAGVNLKNGNFYISYVDLVIPGGTQKLEVNRTYNSKTTKAGWFGYGWGSSFETALEVFADGSAVVHENGSGAIIRFLPKENVNTASASEKIVKTMKEKNPAMSEKSAKDLLEKLKGDSDLRQMYSSKFGVKSDLAVGTVLYSNISGLQELRRTKDGYERRFNDGRLEVFSANGKLVKIADKNGQSIVLAYKDNLVESIKDSNARQIFFSWYPNGKIQSMWTTNNTSGSGKKLEATYKFDNNQNLEESTDVNGNAYKYKYDQNHNMISVTYKDNSKLEIKYDPKTQFTTLVKDRNGVETKYAYASNPKNASLHYWTLVTKPGIDNKPVTNRYEYELKKKNDGSQFIYRVLTEINSVKTETVYDEVSSLPNKITRGSHVTQFKYNTKGLLTEKSSTSGEKVKIDYNEKLNKISRVENNDGWTNYEYDDRGNLFKAYNSEGKSVALMYDNRSGLIKTMVDSDKSSKDQRVLSFEYNALGKPVEISLKNVGKINVDYDNDGEIKKVDSKEGHKMALQVTQAFQNLLSIVKPAGVNLNL
ncbi:MAG: RHS repeat protein [Oligoflexia bacterium]|nr:RHS repeat protein [Oligoflexia bacterium]